MRFEYFVEMGAGASVQAVADHVDGLGGAYKSLSEMIFENGIDLELLNGYETLDEVLNDLEVDTSVMKKIVYKKLSLEFDNFKKSKAGATDSAPASEPPAQETSGASLVSKGKDETPVPEEPLTPEQEYEVKMKDLCKVAQDIAPKSIQLVPSNMVHFFISYRQVSLSLDEL